jgi:hypothetical protein
MIDRQFPNNGHDSPDTADALSTVAAPAVEEAKPALPICRVLSRSANYNVCVLIDVIHLT